MKSKIQELLEKAGYKCQSYSGRGMYGRTCLAVQSNATSIGSFMASLMESYGNDLLKNPNNRVEFDSVINAVSLIRSDNLGKGMIYFFPDTVYEEEEEQI